jgi:hypothetical protein
MLLKISVAAAALVAASALAGAASAQDQAAPADQAAPPAAVQPDASAPAGAPVNAAPATTSSSSSSSGYNVGTPTTDPNTGAQIVTNGPVPDTRANRARFGQPDSHAGRMTKAAGN